MNPRTPGFLLLVPLVVLLAGCSTSRPVDNTYHLDYTQYPLLPQAPTSNVLRTISFIVPGLRQQAIYGNYGGPGSKPGPPVDNMDEIFRRHDISYFEGVTLAELYESDRLLVRRLRALDPKELGWSQNLYRWRAIKFFTSRLSERFGKPKDVRNGSKVRPIVIPGKRLEAERQWNWHGPDPCADITISNEPHTHAAGNLPPNAGTPPQAEPPARTTMAGKFAGRRR